MIRSFICLTCGSRKRLIHIGRVVYGRRGGCFVCKQCVEGEDTP